MSFRTNLGIACGAAVKQLEEEAIVNWNARTTRKVILEGVKISAGTDQTLAMKWIQDEIIFLIELECHLLRLSKLPLSKMLKS